MSLLAKRNMGKTSAIRLLILLQKVACDFSPDCLTGGWLLVVYVWDKLIKSSLCFSPANCQAGQKIFGTLVYQTPRQLMTLHRLFVSDLLSPMKINSFPLSGLAGSLVCQWAVTIGVQGWTWPVNCCWQEENMLTTNRTSQNTDLHFIERGSEQGHCRDVGHTEFLLWERLWCNLSRE